ncbi:MAG: DUF6057 family protein [Parabacteroides sp.]|nr:DUF6057 family protein [Parabacteroides sp.]
MKGIQNYKLGETGSWFLIGILMYVFLQTNFRYHFYYIEQSQMFLFSEAYFNQKVFAIGGFSAWLSEFFVQFFIVPCIGALVVSVWLVGIGIGVKYMLNKLGATNMLVALLPSLALLPMHYDFNYSMQGTVAYLIMMLALCLYVRITNVGIRLLTGMILLPIVYVLAGPIALLMAFIFCIYEWLQKSMKSYYVLIYLVETFIFGIIAVFNLWVTDFRMAFTPFMYYHPMLQPEFVSFYAWIVFPAVILLTYLFRHFRFHTCWVKSGWLGDAIIFLLFSFLLYVGMKTYSNENIRKLQKLDYLTRTSQWDLSIEECEKGMGNLIFQNHYHLALAHKGELSSRVLLANGAGIQSLFVPWNKSDNISTLLSDIYFSIGAVALAQHMAFESYVMAMGKANPRMLQRLVQTNLIYGEYAVAEKYISLLEKTYYYKEWATDHRRFLNNDLAVENDSLLGCLRKGLPTSNMLINRSDISKDLQLIVNECPENSIAVQYLSVTYLLNKDLDAFGELLEMDIYKERVLPVHLQEAVIVLHESEPHRWEKYRVSASVIKRFSEFREVVLANAGVNTSLGRLKREFGDTYWYYYMIK